MSDARFNVDAAQAFRSDMQWDRVETEGNRMEDIYSALCHLRKEHPAIGAGEQTILDNQTVLRTLGSDSVTIHIETNQVIINYNNNEKNDSLIIDLLPDD